MWHLNQDFLTTFAQNMLQSPFPKILICTYFVINLSSLFSQKKFSRFLQKNVYFKENMILVGNWKVELDFRVLAPTSM